MKDNVKIKSDARPNHAILREDRGIVLVIVMMTMVIFLAITGAALFLGGLGLKTSAFYRSGTQTFYATDAGVTVGLNQIGVNQTTSTAAFTGMTSQGLSYRSGRRSDTAPQPLQFNGITSKTGYSIGLGTGYNASGYAFYNYQFNVTGTGASGTAREIEVQAEYGPVPQ
jgi:hypothetical protein